MKRRGFYVGWIALGTLVGCATPPDDGPAGNGATETKRSNLYGNVNYGSDCSPGLEAFLNQTMEYGRISSASAAFSQCLDQTMRSTYRQCIGDPFYGDSIDTQIAQLYAMSHSANDVAINCTGGSGNASTSIGTYGNSSPEALSFAGWLTAVYGQLSLPVCGTPGADPSNCRFLGYPWPYNQAAGIIWHEASHQEGYTHGANDQANAIVACGYSGDQTWNFQVNTAPYILQSCIDNVIWRSGQYCGSTLETCGDNALSLIDGYSSTTCTCVTDPRPTGLGALGIPAGASGLQEIEKTATGDWMGGWHLGSDDVILGLADVDGDQAKDLIVRSPWGLGFISGRGGNMVAIALLPWGSTLGSWTLSDSDTFEFAGDFDGDGRDEVLFMSAAGNLVSLHVDTTNTIGAEDVINADQFLGGWHYNTDDTLVGAADFDGNGTTDLLIRSPWGVGILTRAGGSWTSLVAVPYGTWAGGWNLGIDDQFGWFGDFDGNGTGDFVALSGWGIGLLTLSGGSLSALNVSGAGTWFGGWNFDPSNNAIAGIGDFNGAQRSDILISSPWGIGIVYLDGWGNMQSLSVHGFGDILGTWNLGSDDTFRGVGDFDGNGTSDILVTSPWGAGVLGFNGDLAPIWMGPYGTLLGDWWFTADDVIEGVGDVNGDGRADVVMWHQP